jgi:exopolysaccharide production protein ExoQ
LSTAALHTIDHTRFLKTINWLLLAILFTMVAGFFSWSENVIITRVIKVIGRMGMLGASWLVYQKIINYGAVDSLRPHNVLALLLYLLYLGLGLASFLWTSNIGVSALQWFMTSQTLIFCYFFIKSLYLLDEYFPGHNVRLYNLVGNASLALIVIFLIGMWVYPDDFIRYTNEGTEARLGGFIMNPNELGMLAGVGVAGFLFDIKRNYQKIFTVIKILILFYALYLTGSRSSLIGAVFIILFYIKQTDNTRLKLAIIGGMILVLPFSGANCDLERRRLRPGGGSPEHDRPPTILERTHQRRFTSRTLAGIWIHAHRLQRLLSVEAQLPWHDDPQHLYAGVDESRICGTSHRHLSADLHF